MSRLWSLGTPIQVVMDGADVPLSFFWRDQTHRVHTVANHWRIDQEWWRIRLARDYFLVATSTGLLVTIFRDRLTDEWYLQRLYD